MIQSQLIAGASAALAVGCGAVILSILALHLRVRREKMQAAYFLNAGRIRLAWNILVLSTVPFIAASTILLVARTQLTETFYALAQPLSLVISITGLLVFRQALAKGVGGRRPPAKR